MILLFSCDTSETNNTDKKKNDLNVIEQKINESNPEKSKDFFKDFNLKLNYKPKDILPPGPVKKHGGDERNISNIQIDSIKNAARNFIPSEVLNSDIIIMKTNFGNMKLKFFSNFAPNHCYNFKRLANSGYYDNTLFHRVIKSFMIQGGDILSRDSNLENDGTGDPGWNINSEFNSLMHKRGTLSMARGGSPNSAGSQFFICHRDAPHLDNKYTIFGEVVENIHVIDRIASTPTHYSSARMGCSNTIPPGENIDDWIKLQDPKNGRDIYSKIPEGFSSSEHKRIMNKELRNDQPILPVVIKEVRVLKINE